jgi:hypothetical protein
VILDHDLRLAVDLAAEAVFGVVGGEDDAGPSGAQRCLDLGHVVPDGRDDPHPGDDDTAHGQGLPARRGAQRFRGRGAREQGGSATDVAAGVRGALALATPDQAGGLHRRAGMVGRRQDPGPEIRTVRRVAAFICLALLAGCAAEDLAAPPVPLGDFALGLNVAVADNAQRVPISREATAEEWEAAMETAVADRFGRYAGTRLFNIGISIDGYALAPPGIPVVAAPKSVLVVTANVWEDATQTKLNAEGHQITVFEGLSGDTVIGSGLTRTKEQQMATLSANAVRAVEAWFLANPDWFGIVSGPTPAAATASAAAGPEPSAPVAADPPERLPVPPQTTPLP